jgi:flagellar biosynthesis GTPase FlhF
MEEEILNRLQAFPERRNPFDEGIAKAVSSTRSNLGMSRDQEHRAINNALLALGNGLANEPVQRGFKNNLGVIGRAMNPALSAYNTSEDAALKENEQLANQILQHQRAQEALEAAKEEKAWHRKFQERQLEETKRHHNLLDNFKRDKREEKSLLNNFKKGKEEREKQDALDELKGMLLHAENTVTNLGSEGERSPLGKYFRSKFSNQEYSPDQAKIWAIGEVLRGKLNKAFKYTNQEEFKHIPTISPDNDMATNINVINDLRAMLGISAEEGIKNSNNGDRVLMLDPITGTKDWVHKDWVQDAIDNDGLQVLDE